MPVPCEHYGESTSAFDERMFRAAVAQRNSDKPIIKTTLHNIRAVNTVEEKLLLFLQCRACMSISQDYSLRNITTLSIMALVNWLTQKMALDDAYANLRVSQAAAERLAKFPPPPQ